MRGIVVVRCRVVALELRDGAKRGKERKGEGAFTWYEQPVVQGEGGRGHMTSYVPNLISRHSWRLCPKRGKRNPGYYPGSKRLLA